MFTGQIHHRPIQASDCFSQRRLRQMGDICKGNKSKSSLNQRLSSLSGSNCPQTVQPCSWKWDGDVSLMKSLITLSFSTLLGGLSGKPTSNVFEILCSSNSSSLAWHRAASFCLYHSCHFFVFDKAGLNTERHWLHEDVHWCWFRRSHAIAIWLLAAMKTLWYLLLDWYAFVANGQQSVVLDNLPW